MDGHLERKGKALEGKEARLIGLVTGQSVVRSIHPGTSLTNTTKKLYSLVLRYKLSHTHYTHILSHLCINVLGCYILVNS